MNRRPSLRGHTALAPYSVVAAAHLASQVAGADAVADITQVLLMPALAGYLVSMTDGHIRTVRLTLVALAFSWLGDSAPRLMSGDAAFAAMLGFFLLAQLAYITAFWPSRGQCIATTGRLLPIPMR